MPTTTKRIPKTTVKETGMTPEAAFQRGLEVLAQQAAACTGDPAGATALRLNEPRKQARPVRSGQDD